MGEKITRQAEEDVARVKLLRQALARGVREFLPGQAADSDPGSFLTSDNPEIQKAYLEQLLECAPEALTILDRQQRVTRINGEFTRMFGFEPEEAIGQKIEDLIIPNEREVETRWTRDVLAQGRKVTLETKRRHKNGSQLDVLISAAPVMVDGKVVAAYSLYRDISEQKRAERLSRALYRIAEKTSSAGSLQQFYADVHAILSELLHARNFYIALYDARTQLLSFPYFVNERAAAPERQKLGKGRTEYVLSTGEPLLCTPETLDVLIERGEVEAPSPPCLDWLGVPLKSANGTFGVLAVQSYSPEVRFRERDKEILTVVSSQLASAIEHKRKEQALRQSEARYRSLVESAVYGMGRLSRSGAFLDTNPALVAMLGYDSAERVLALCPRTDVFVDPEEFARLMEDFRQGKQVSNVEVRWKRKSGRAILVRLSGCAVSQPEDQQVIEFIAEDVTEHRVLENQFRQAQKMEAVGRLAGGVAHDFNNLLLIIRGYTEVLLEQTDLYNPTYAKIEAIMQAAERATSLTRQLLAFSRKQLLELKLVDLNAIVNGLDRLLKPLVGESIELNYRLASDLGHTRADAGQMEQVIMNLVVNAKDAMPEGGRIRIETSNVVVGEEIRKEHSYFQPGSYAMLTVSDTGCGMDPETQARIFEPFFTTKEKGKGTGLGLSTVYGIIKQSRGYIFAQSAVGKGTTFRIYLPRVDDAVQASAPIAATKSARGGTETVLLVEDEESVRELVKETLESKGYKVLQAEQGDAALNIAASHSGRIDILISDVVMPGISGRELAKKLAETHPDIKILYVSGYTEEAIIHQGVLEPGTAFLQKPFTLQALSRKVQDVLHPSSGD
jgi:two-component system cell cycle sensor histidine kinase/response regulator CckA